MQLKSELAAVFLCIAAMCNSAQAQPAAAQQASTPTARTSAAQQPAPQQAPAQPVKYQLLLASSLLLMMFGRRGAVRAKPFSKH